MGTKYWKLGIIGWPLGYSLSPRMHHAALKAVGLEGEYEEYPVKPEHLDRWLREEAPQLDGFNVTMPYKEAAYHWLKRHGEVLDLLLWKIEAVNTIRIEKKKNLLVGSDTDGAGFYYGLSEQQRAALNGKAAVLRGAGGAAWAIAGTLIRPGKVGSLRIWNRHPERAETLAEKLREYVLKEARNQSQSAANAVTEISTLSDLHAIGDCDWLVNATPAGMNGYEELPLDYSRLHRGQIVYDIVYEPRETRLIREARRRGCDVVTGDKMLAGQGAAAFSHWTGAPVEKVLPAMQKALEEHYKTSSPATGPAAR